MGLITLVVESAPFASVLSWFVFFLLCSLVPDANVH